MQPFTFPSADIQRERTSLRTWKAIWLIAIGLPLWQAHRVDPDTMETLKACAFGVVLMLIVIPLRYAFDTFLKAPGDRWGFTNLAPKSTRAVS